MLSSNYVLFKRGVEIHDIFSRIKIKKYSKWFNYFYDFEIINKTFNYLTLIFKKNVNIEVFRVINMYVILVS